MWIKNSVFSCISIFCLICVFPAYYAYGANKSIDIITFIPSVYDQNALPCQGVRASSNKILTSGLCAEAVIKASLQKKRLVYNTEGQSIGALYGYENPFWTEPGHYSDSEYAVTLTMTALTNPEDQNSAPAFSDLNAFQLFNQGRVYQFNAVYFDEKMDVYEVDAPMHTAIYPFFLSGEANQDSLLPSGTPVLNKDGTLMCLVLGDYDCGSPKSLALPWQRGLNKISRLLMAGSPVTAPPEPCCLTTNEDYLARCVAYCKQFPCTPCSECESVLGGLLTLSKIDKFEAGKRLGGVALVTMLIAIRDVFQRKSRMMATYPF